MSRLENRPPFDRRAFDDRRGGPPGRPDEHDDRPRLFFAIPVPDAARDAVASVAERVKASTDGGRARWVRFEGLHLTLRFLGPTPPEAVPALGQALVEVAGRTRPFEIVLGGGGAFPSLPRPRTLWVGVVVGGDALATLADELSADPRIAPLVPERADTGGAGGARRFAPHLTIARTDGIRGASAVARALQAEAKGLEARFAADRVVLYRSLLGSGPARYEALIEAALGG